MARLKSHIWVSAFVRAQNNAQHFTAIAHKGDEDAGAIYVKVAHYDRTATLLGPAVLGDDTYDRSFEILMTPRVPEMDIDAHLDKQRGWDGDCWVIEVECDDIEALGLPINNAN